MPAQSQQQQKLFGLALAFKRGEVPSSEVSDEIKAIADRMSEKDIEDFAATKHKGLPKMKEQLRKIVREIMREKVISEMELSKDEMDKLHSDGEVEVDGEKVTYDESVNEDVSKYTNAGIRKFAVAIASLTATRPDAVQKFVDSNELNIEKLHQFVKKGKLSDRMDFVSAIAGKPNNPIQKKMIKMFKESVNEGISVFDERFFGKTGIIIMIDDNGKKVSAIFKDKKNADKYNRNNPSDIKKLLDLAKKTKYPNAIDESVNEGYSTEEKRIVLMAVKKISKYMNVDLPTAMNYLLGAGHELERDIERGKIK
jgi:hypothetical protein